MNNTESFKATLIAHAARHYKNWKLAADDRIALVAYEYNARYEALADLAKDAFGITPEQFRRMVKSMNE